MVNKSHRSWQIEKWSFVLKYLKMVNSRNLRLKRHFNPVNNGMTVINTTFQRFRLQLEFDIMNLRSPGFILNRRLSMRPSPEELEERNILRSKSI